MPEAAAAWTPWAPAACRPSFSEAGFKETIDGGQMFRWNWVAEGSYWQGVWGSNLARLRLLHDGQVEWSVPVGNATDQPASLFKLIGLDRNYAELFDTLPWRSDPVLASAMEQYRGLRMVHQPLGEALLGFLCSSMKRIPQIKEVMELLAARFGAEIAFGIKALPDWDTLAKISEAELRQCKLGYRARYIHQTARWLQSHPGFLDEIAGMPYLPARSALTQLPGVGVKIADCVLLYGGGKLESFPVDTWIIKAMADFYGLSGWTPEQIAHFGRVHFGSLAGLAQQYLFAFARLRSKQVLQSEQR